METMEVLKGRLAALEAQKRAYNHAIGVLSYDAATGAPVAGAENRGKTMKVLSEVVYNLETGEDTVTLLKALKEREAELDEVSAREVRELLRSYEKTSRIPMDEYLAYAVLLNEADAVWHEAKEKSDWKRFEPYLKKIVDYNRRYAAYLDDQKQPYDVLLDEFERGLTMEVCDGFFGELKEALIPLIHRITKTGKQPDIAFLHQEYPIETQRRLSDWLMETIGIDRRKCSIRETEHPFTENFCRDDVRITTHYYADDVTSSMFSVIHEGGHALYELNIGDRLCGTCLETGVSMGIHESQSRFFENLIGRSRGFSAIVRKKLTELFPQQMAGVSDEAFYRAVNLAQPSLIRTEADELTYCLHIIIRYELEKRLIQDGAEVSELPKLWNEKVKEYLGLDVPDDRHGVLQDSHWSGGAIGYFPSYALGSAYGAQLLAKMRETVDVDRALAEGDFTAVNAWLTERIWSKGSLIDPKPLFEAAAEGKFDPKYYIDYLTKKYSELYGV